MAAGQTREIAKCLNELNAYNMRHAAGDDQLGEIIRDYFCNRDDSDAYDDSSSDDSDADADITRCAFSGRGKSVTAVDDNYLQPGGSGSVQSPLSLASTSSSMNVVSMPAEPSANVASTSVKLSTRAVLMPVDETSSDSDSEGNEWYIVLCKYIVYAICN